MIDIDEKRLAELLADKELRKLLTIYVDEEVEIYKSSSFDIDGVTTEEMRKHLKNIGAVNALTGLLSSLNDLPEKHGVKPNA